MSCSILLLIAYVIGVGPLVFLVLRRLAQESELERLLRGKTEVSMKPGFDELDRTKYEFLKMKIINHHACWTTLWKILK